MKPSSTSYLRSGASPRLQRGAALIVALILLVVITLVGLAAIGTTIIQNKASANQYDRQIAFQSAEAAMRVAAALVPNNPGLIARNCQAGGTICQANPFMDTTLPSGSIHTVTAGSGSGTATTFTASPAAAMQPQFVVESLGNWINPSQNVGFGNTANARNYGVQGTASTAIYYRITARSCDPKSSSCDNRAIVTLQAIVRQG
ncbi:MAG TPA: PilX N-terminal domain-containing pilus assembly protein [Rhodanobacteraceae bacterium]|nr:PilX N-terminal domain-containing pilus assembly protein [Rhodanobacteraceae bacterium]